MAANDFLRNPTLMMASYLEWAAAVQTLIKSGQLSTAGQPRQPHLSPAPAPHDGDQCAACRLGLVRGHSTRLLLPIRFRSLCLAASIQATELAEILELAPAACLDYLDAAYMKIDVDGEFKGAFASRRGRRA